MVTHPDLITEQSRTGFCLFRDHLTLKGFFSKLRSESGILFLLDAFTHVYEHEHVGIVERFLLCLCFICAVLCANCMGFALHC